LWNVASLAHLCRSRGQRGHQRRRVDDRASMYTLSPVDLLQADEAAASSATAGGVARYPLRCP
jgi:hypothetical protein